MVRAETDICHKAEDKRLISLQQAYLTPHNRGLNDFAFLGGAGR